MSSEQVKKIYLWTADRSLGTVFLKLLSTTRNAVVFNGLYTAAYLFGPEAQRPLEKPPHREELNRLTKGFPNVFDDDLCTYAWAKKRLEAPHEGKIMFAKDQAYALCERYDLIPPNFHHTFIIRHPYKSIPSVKKELVDYQGLQDSSLSMSEISSKYYAPRHGYGELHDLIFYLLEKKQPVVIMDADDLQEHPESIIRQYCAAVNIPYQDSYINWGSGMHLLHQWHISRLMLYYGIVEDTGYYSTAIKSSRFLPRKPIPSKEALPEDTWEIVDSVMPYYQTMFGMRLKPNPEFMMK